MTLYVVFINGFPTYTFFRYRSAYHYAQLYVGVVKFLNLSV